MKPALVTLEGLSKRFAPDALAVRDFSLRIEPGSLVSLVGPSGCGKTTTLRLIAGLEEPDSGSITVDGVRWNGVPPARRDVAMVFQDSTQYPHMTVRNNMAFPLRMRGLPRAEIAQRIEETANLCRIVDILDRTPGTLSGGQLQRAALARALVRQPRVLLLDEPLSGLDAPLRGALRSELRRLQQRLGITNLYVTHDQEEAMAVGDQVAVMHRGAVQQVDSPINVYRQPHNRFVASFIGQPGMNFLNGRLIRTDGSVCFADGGQLRVDLFKAVGSCADRLPLDSAVLGVRPEHLRVAEPDHIDQRSVSFITKLVSKETIGEWANARFLTGAGDEVVARISADLASRLSGEVKLECSPQNLLLFEPGEFGRRLIPSVAVAE